MFGEKQHQSYTIRICSQIFPRSSSASVLRSQRPASQARGSLACAMLAARMHADILPCILIDPSIFECTRWLASWLASNLGETALPRIASKRIRTHARMHTFRHMAFCRYDSMRAHARASKTKRCSASSTLDRCTRLVRCSFAQTHQPVLLQNTESKGARAHHPCNSFANVCK